MHVKAKLYQKGTTVGLVLKKIKCVWMFCDCQTKHLRWTCPVVICIKSVWRKCHFIDILNAITFTF